MYNNLMGLFLAALLLMPGLVKADDTNTTTQPVVTSSAAATTPAKTSMPTAKHKMMKKKGQPAHAH